MSVVARARMFEENTRESLDVDKLQQGHWWQLQRSRAALGQLPPARLKGASAALRTCWLWFGERYIYLDC